VAMCGQCHTPVDSNGNPDRTRWLQGGPEPYMPARPNSDWPISAPRIGGTPPADDADHGHLDHRRSSAVSDAPVPHGAQRCRGGHRLSEVAGSDPVANLTKCSTWNTIQLILYV
jgi:hypothetical protein